MLYNLPNDWPVASWSAPLFVHAFTTTRNGGVSQGCYGGGMIAGVRQGGMNAGVLGEDDPQHLAQNRAILQRYLPSSPVWLKQVHGVAVINAADIKADADMPEADAAFSFEPNVVCVVRTADCLPVFFTDQLGQFVAVAHAGWRGLLAGVLEATLLAVRKQRQHNQLISSPILAHLGPAIGASVFEVGQEVRDQFVNHNAATAAYFVATGTNGKYMADLYSLARLRLMADDVIVSGVEDCTFSQPDKYFSYRREHPMGHMASVIWKAA